MPSTPTPSTTSRIASQRRADQRAQRDVANPQPRRVQPAERAAPHGRRARAAGAPSTAWPRNRAAAARRFGDPPRAVDAADRPAGPACECSVTSMYQASALGVRQLRLRRRASGGRRRGTAPAIQATRRSRSRPRSCGSCVRPSQVIRLRIQQLEREIEGRLRCRSGVDMAQPVRSRSTFGSLADRPRRDCRGAGIAEYFTASSPCAKRHVAPVAGRWYGWIGPRCCRAPAHGRAKNPIMSSNEQRQERAELPQTRPAERTGSA